MAGKEIFQALVAWCQTFNRQEHEALLETAHPQSCICIQINLQSWYFCRRICCTYPLYHFGQELRYKWQNHTAIFFVLHSDWRLVLLGNRLGLHKNFSFFHSCEWIYSMKANKLLYSLRMAKGSQPIDLSRLALVVNKTNHASIALPRKSQDSNGRKPTWDRGMLPRWGLN